MSERKVLNKYYPPDFDPSKIPKLKEARNGVFSIRIMAPFNMRCNVCGEYIYKGKKFNSRKENVDNEDFLGLRIFRFYIRCPKCVAEIAFKTDLKNTDYTLEAGATRLFEAEKLAQKMAEEERKAKEAEELNPMKVLENRTKASHKEMAQIDQLEELREINARHAKADIDSLIDQERLYEEHLLKLQKEEEDEIIESIFGKRGSVIKRLADSDDEEEANSSKQKVTKPDLENGSQHATDILVGTTVDPKSRQACPPKCLSVLSTRSGLAALVRKKSSIACSEDKSPSSLLINSHPVFRQTTCSTSTSQSDENRLEGISRRQVPIPTVDITCSTAVRGLSTGSKPSHPDHSSALDLLCNYSESESSQSE